MLSVGSLLYRRVLVATGGGGAEGEEGEVVMVVVVVVVVVVVLGRAGGAIRSTVIQQYRNAQALKMEREVCQSIGFQMVSWRAEMVMVKLRWRWGG
jgi:hypothetical protein